MCIYENRGLEKDDYREKLMQEINTSHEKLKRAVEQFNSPVASKPINKNDLELFPFNVWVSLNDLIEIRKRKNRFGNYLNFDTKMKKGARFGEHFHEDIIESAEVLAGEMIDEVDDRVYKEGDVAHYDKGTIHKPVATKETMLHVLFKP